jgi:tetratricopeptide (TPR) repeat protein
MGRSLGCATVFWRKPYDRNVALATAEKAKVRGSVRKAVRWFRKVIEHAPQDFQTRAKIAPLLARLRRWDEAKTNFDVAAAGFLAAGFAPKAIAVWTVAALTFPEHVEYWERIANEEVRRGCRQDAVNALLKGRAQLRKKRQRPLAALLLRQVLALEGTHLGATLDLADLLRRDGVREEARRLLAAVLGVAAGNSQRRRVRFAQFRLEPTFRGVLNWALAR